MLNFIFDLDGTLVNSSAEVLLCFEKAFEKTGYVIDKSRLTHNVIGPPLKQIIQLIAPDIDEDNLNSVMKNFRQVYDFDENDISVMYDGVENYLNKLSRENKKIFLATFKPTIPTMRILKKFGLNMFEDIYTIDKFGKHITKEEMIKDIVSKYNLENSETVMVGDAASDVIAAKNAGVTAVGALWGYGTDKSRLIENSDITINNIEELECLKSSSQTMLQKD